MLNNLKNSLFFLKSTLEIYKNSARIFFQKKKRNKKNFLKNFTFLIFLHDYKLFEKFNLISQTNNSLNKKFVNDAGHKLKKHYYYVKKVYCDHSFCYYDLHIIFSNTPSGQFINKRPLFFTSNLKDFRNCTMIAGNAQRVRIEKNSVTDFENDLEKIQKDTYNFNQEKFNFFYDALKKLNFENKGFEVFEIENDTHMDFFVAITNLHLEYVSDKTFELSETDSEILVNMLKNPSIINIIKFQEQVIFKLIEKNPLQGQLYKTKMNIIFDEYKSSFIQKKELPEFSKKFDENIKNNSKNPDYICKYNHHQKPFIDKDKVKPETNSQPIKKTVTTNLDDLD